MSVQTYQHSFEFSKAIEATIEHVVRAGQAPQIIIHYHHRATLEPSQSISSESRRDRSTEPPGLSSLAGIRIVTSQFRYKLVQVSEDEDFERTSDLASRTSASARYPNFIPLEQPRPVRSSTGLSTPEPTPPRPPNRAEDPRRCQSLTQKGAQCLRRPAAARNVLSYGWYCWQHGNTGDVPSSSASLTGTRSSLPHPLQFRTPARPHVITSRFSTPDSAPSRVRSSTSRPVEILPTPSPEPEPVTAPFFENVTAESTPSSFVQSVTSHTRAPTPPRPLRLPQMLGLSPQSPTLHLADNIPEQTPSHFRRTHRASGSSSLSSLGWPTTPVRVGSRRGSSSVSAAEPAQDLPASPVLVASPVPSSASSIPSPLLSPALVPTESPTLTPIPTPALSPVLSPLSPPVLSPTLSSIGQSFAFGADFASSSQRRVRRITPAHSSPLPSTGLRTPVVPDTEPTQATSIDLTYGQDQREPNISEVVADATPEVSSASPAQEAVNRDNLAQSEATMSEKVEEGGLSASEFSFRPRIRRASSRSSRLILPLPRRSRRTAASLFAPGTTVNIPSLPTVVSSQTESRADGATPSELALPEVCSPHTPAPNSSYLEANIAGIEEQPSARSHEQGPADAEELTPSSSSPLSPTQPPTSNTSQQTFATAPKVIQTDSRSVKRLPFVSRLPRPSSTGTRMRASFDGSLQESKSRAPSRIPRLAARASEPLKPTEHVAPKARLGNKGVNNAASQSRSTPSQCSLAPTTELCPRAARRSEGSTKPIDFLIQNGPERFSDYIPQDLSAATQDKLRRKMQQAPTGSAAKGYIYALEITSMSTDEYICVKIGRTTDPEEPLRRWRAQCPSSRVNLGGVWPALRNQENKLNKPVQMIKYCSTLEDLVRLELGNLAQYNAHIPHRKSISPVSAEFSPTQCEDCGARHKDIYTIKRSGRKDGRTHWDFLDETVQRWSRFVSQYCGHE